MGEENNIDLKECKVFINGQEVGISKLDIIKLCDVEKSNCDEEIKKIAPKEYNFKLTRKNKKEIRKIFKNYLIVDSKYQKRVKNRQTLYNKIKKLGRKL